MRDSMLLRNLIAVLFVMLFHYTAVAESTRIYGSFRNQRTQRIEIIPAGIASEIYATDKISIIGDSTGKFDVTVEIEKPGYYISGKSILYIKPGDAIEFYPSTNPMNTEFQGSGSEFNNYLKGADWSDDIYDYRTQERRPFGILKKIVDSLSLLRVVQLQGVHLKDPGLYDMELARINADKVSSYLSYYVFARISDYKDTDSVKNEKKINFYKSIKEDINPILKYISSNEEFLEISSVRKLLQDCSIYDFLSFDRLERYKELLSVKRQSEIMDGGITKSNQRELNDFISSIKHIPLKRAYQQKLLDRSRLMEGTPALDFTMRDAEGNVHKLSEFKGKVLFVDFWATWCLPCLGQTPHVKAISEKFENICFVAVSVDQDVEKWRKYIAKSEEKTISQFNANVFELQKLWDLESIPRFLLIDKDFNIISAYVVRPSDKNAIETMLNKYN